MVQPAERADAFGNEAGQFVIGQFGRAFAAIDGAEARDPVRDLDQRDAHQPRAALFGASREADHGAQRGEIAGDVVVGLHRHVARLLQGALRRGEAGYVLHDRVEAAPCGPGTFVAVGTDADADDARPQLGQPFRREAARRQRSRPITLGKDIGLAHQSGQRLDAGRLAEIDPGTTLAVAGVHQQFALIRQVRGGDVEHVGTVLGQNAAAGRAGQHSGEIQHANTAERPVAFQQWPRRCLADLDDVDQRQSGDRDAMRMGVPFVAAAYEAADAVAGCNCFFDGKAIPHGDGLGQRLARLGPGAGDAQCTGTMVRMVGVQEHGPAVPCRIVAGQWIPRHRPLAVAPDIGIGAQRSRGGTQVDAHGLGLAGAQAPQVGDCKADRSQ